MYHLDLELTVSRQAGWLGNHAEVVVPLFAP